MFANLISNLKKKNTDDSQVMYQFYIKRLKQHKVKNPEKIASKIRDTIKRVESKTPKKK